MKIEFTKLLDAPNKCQDNDDYIIGTPYALEVTWVDDKSIAIKTDQMDDIVYSVDEIEALYNFTKGTKYKNITE